MCEFSVACVVDFGCAVVLGVGASTPAAAQPAAEPQPPEATEVSNRAPHVVETRAVSPTHTVVDVYSPAMDRVISNDVLRPAHGGSLPTLYLLNGALGGEDGVGWMNNSQAPAFFADKDVTVVLPIGGRFSFYTDWGAPDPILGINMWETYLTRELPGVIDREFGGTGLNAVAGLSMSGGPALDLAIQAPELYQAAASFSGCPAPSNLLATVGISTMIASGLNNPFNMWGPPGSRGWKAHDPAANAAKLAGTPCTSARLAGLWARWTRSRRVRSRRSAAWSSKDSSTDAPQCSSIRSKQPVSRRRCRCARRAPTPGHCSRISCGKRGTPRSPRHCRRAESYRSVESYRSRVSAVRSPRTSARTSAPNCSSFLAPIPGIDTSARSSAGCCSAIATRVLSVNTT